jgi:hypothetical protein
MGSPKRNTNKIDTGKSRSPKRPKFETASHAITNVIDNGTPSGAISAGFQIDVTFVIMAGTRVHCTISMRHDSLHQCQKGLHRHRTPGPAPSVYGAIVSEDGIVEI